MKKLLALAATGLFCVGCSEPAPPAPISTPTTTAPGGMHGEPPAGGAETPEATGEPTPADAGAAPAGEPTPADAGANPDQGANP